MAEVVPGCAGRGQGTPVVRVLQCVGRRLGANFNKQSGPGTRGELGRGTVYVRRGAFLVADQKGNQTAH